MKSFNVIVLLCSCLILDQANALSLTNVIKSTKDIGLGVAKDIRNIVPTPTEFFDLGKQAIAGYPFEIASTAINKFCSAAVATDSIKPKVTPDISKMNFQLRTACERYSFPLLEADQMWRSPQFDAKKKVVILATGWTTTINGSETIDAFAKAYNCRGDINFVAVDAANYVDTLYSWSALNTEAIGEAMAKGLVELTEIVPLENIHLIGHSLGAHIVGSAARKFSYSTGKLIPHVTGLDPAKPCFNEGEDLSGLQRGDAEFIDVIHSNPGVLGKREPLGDVDFYPGGLEPLPPGCLSIVCAHERSWQYYLETVYPANEYDFMAKRCNSLTKLRDGKCPGQAVPMGFAVPHNVKGNYFLEVNGDPPFGKEGNKSRDAKYEECGICKS